MKSEPDVVFGQIYENTSCVFTLKAVVPLVLRSWPDLRLHILCNRPADCLRHPKMLSMHFGELTVPVLHLAHPPDEKKGINPAGLYLFLRW